MKPILTASTVIFFISLVGLCNGPFGPLLMEQFLWAISTVVSGLLVVVTYYTGQ